MSTLWLLANVISKTILLPFFQTFQTIIKVIWCFKSDFQFENTFGDVSQNDFFVTNLGKLYIEQFSGLEHLNEKY